MSGKAIIICKDSILGFAFTYLLEQDNTSNHKISQEQYESIKKDIIYNAKLLKGREDLVEYRETDRKGRLEKQYFTQNEVLETVDYEEMFVYDKYRKEYSLKKGISLGYLQATYNQRNSYPIELYSLYKNEKVLEKITPPELI